MTDSWIQNTPVDKWRATAAFEQFPKALPDPDGRLDQWLEHIRIVPLWTKEWKCAPGWRIGPRVLNETMWYWFQNGSGWFSLGKGGTRKNFRSGDLILIPQGVEHVVRPEDGRGVHNISVHFHVHLFSSVNLLNLLGFPGLVPAPAESPLGTASLALAREYALRAPGWKPAMTNRIYDALLYIIRHHGKLFHPPESSLHQLLPRLLPALECIEHELDNPTLAVGDLARKIKVSEVYLRRLFKKVTGARPAAFIQRRRVERACELLRFTSKGIKLIAAETGFRELTFFYRVFGYWTGTTPARYRQTK